MIGVIGGLLGAVFIRVNNQINAIRKKILTTKGRKVAETLLLAFITVSIMYFAVTLNYWAGGKTYKTDEDFCQIDNFTNVTI